MVLKLELKKKTIKKKGKIHLLIKFNKKYFKF